MKLYEKIKNNEIYFIAEMSANHAGKLENALEIVNRAKEAGADCLKIQTYTADTLTLDCDNEYFQIQTGLWKGYKRYDLYKEAYTPWEWQPVIKQECERLGLDFLSTPFDKTAVDFLEAMGLEFYKIASFELIDIPLLTYTASKGKPMILSCGLASIEEIEEAVDAIETQGNHKIILLKCCSEYPADDHDMNLRTILDMKKRFGYPVGLSDHSMGDIADVTGAVLGACVIEKHFCISRSIPNPDSAFSMEPEEYRRMVENVNRAKVVSGKVSYERTEKEQNSAISRRSIFAYKNIHVGEIFTEENCCIVRPAYGLKPKYYKQLLGKKAVREIKRGEPLYESDLQETSGY